MVFTPRRFRKDESVDYEMTVWWPGYFRRLVAGENDSNYWQLRPGGDFKAVLRFERRGAFLHPPIVELIEGDGAVFREDNNTKHHEFVIELASQGRKKVTAKFTPQ
jgi:hypothetical protein